MRWRGTKKYFLYLKGSNLIGVEWQKGNLRKVLDTSLDNLPFETELAGEATMLFDKESLQHQVMSVPSRGKLSLKKMAAHEVENLMGCSSSDLVYDWRIIGRGTEEGVPQTLFLLAAHHQPEISSLLHNLNRLGLKVSKIISSLDLLIEKGRTLQIKGGSGLMVFEEPLVHFLFFRDGTYGFQRSFELREEGFQKEFLLEIQRSFFYTKQKFKIPIERVSVLLAPEWLQGALANQLQETLGVPVDFLPPNLGDCEFPEIKLLNILITELNLLPSLLNLVPAEIIREMETRKFSWAITFTEIVLLSLALLWTYNTRDFLKEGRSFYTIREKQLKSVKTRLEGQHDKIERFKKLEEEARVVKDYLKQKNNLYLYLESLPFLIPENVYLESFFWGASSDRPVQATSPPSSLGKPKDDNLIMLNGRVDSLSSDEKYSLFFQFLSNLEASPFVEKVSYQSERLLTEGQFQISVYVKKIRPRYGSH